LFHISTRGPWSRGKQGISPELSVPAGRSLVGADGGVGKHQEVIAHPLVTLDGRERARGGLATCTCRRRRRRPVVVALRRSSTSAERARDEQHDAAEALNYLVWAEKARSSEHCGGCELRPSAMADAAAFSLCQARARRGSGRGSVGECGEDARSFPHQQRARTRGGHAARRGGASSAWLSTRSPTDAFCRTAGERRCGQSGTPIWAISRPI
jgi:hypothetical protein